MRSISERHRHTSGIAALLIVFTIFAAEAQKPGQRPEDFNTTVEVQLKDVTATGPFPLYLRIQPFSLFMAGNDDVTRAFDAFNRYRGTALKTPRLAWGYNLDLGARLFNTLILEAGYTQLLRTENFHATNVRVNQRNVAFRAGAAIGIYYPLSFQVCAGFVSTTTDFVINEPGTAGDTRRKIGFGEGVLKGRLGWDVSARLMLMDPVGAGGGLGFFVELRYLWYDQPADYRPYIELLQSSATEAFQSDLNFRIYSIGVIAPLALRLNLGN